MTAFRALLRAELAVFRRDKAAMLFTFLFPIVFILIFGFLLGDMGTDTVRIGVFVVPDTDDALLMETLARRPLLTVVPVERVEALDQAVHRRDVDVGIIWDGVRLSFVYDPTRVQEQKGYTQLATGITDDFNLNLQGADRLLGVRREHAGRAEEPSWLSMTVPAIIAFTLLSAGLYAVAGHITAMKERRILDRMVMAPLNPTALVGAIACVRLGVVCVSTFLTLGIALTVFDVHLTMNWPRYLLVLVAGTLGSMALGTAITLVVRRPSSAGNLASILAMAMMFLSGVYFPVELLPGYLRTVSRGLPLTYMVEAMRDATGVADMHPTRFWALTGALLATAVLLLPALARYIVRPARG